MNRMFADSLDPPLGSEAWSAWRPFAVNGVVREFASKPRLTCH